MTDADALGGPGHVGQEGLGGTHVCVHGESGVLDRPDDVEIHLLGQQRLLAYLAEDPVVPLAGGIRGLGFVDQRESHV